MNTSVLALGILPDPPAEDDEVSLKDGLMRLGELHCLSGPAMEVIFRALLPKKKLPEDQAALARRLQGARERVKAWKISAGREGAR